MYYVLTCNVSTFQGLKLYLFFCLLLESSFHHIVAGAMSVCCIRKLQVVDVKDVKMLFVGSSLLLPFKKKHANK